MENETWKKETWKTNPKEQNMERDTWKKNGKIDIESIQGK